MTAVWGPLGWMTLHSISTSYPEAPSIAEKQLVSSWLDMFRDTITCPYCRDHFSEMLANSRRVFPNFLNSRQDLAIFVFRVHNAVNRRLKKPIYESVAACMERLQENIKLRSAKEYRVAYLNHIARFWATLQDISGLIAAKKVNEMRRIEGEYFGPKDTNFAVEIREDIVVVPRGVLEKDAPDSIPRITAPTARVLSRAQVVQPERTPSRMPLGVGFKMTPAGLRLR
jgi:hypothetical protein